MSTTAYNARVKYETGEPHDAGYGASINVALEILDGNGEQDLSAPKLKESGLLNVYKKVDTKDAEYISSLKQGDEITVQYIQQGDKSYYDFVIPAGWTAPVAKKERAVIATPSTPPTQRMYEPMSDGEIEARKAYMDQEAGLVTYAFGKLDQWAKLSEYPISYDAMLSTANGLRISSERTHTKGTVLGATKEGVEEFKIGMFENALDQDDLITTSLDAIVGFAPVEYDLAQLKKDMTYIGIQRSAFDTKRDCINTAKIIWEMLLLIKGGMDRDAALSSTRNQNGW